MKYIMGLDNGGTITKATIYTMNGFEVSACAMPTVMIAEKRGYVERDMEEMWRTNCQVIRECLSKGKVKPNDIIGLGICGHGKGLYLWGKNNHPVRNGIISTDNRAYAYPLKWEKDGTAELVFAKTFQKILPCQPVALLAWMKDNESESLKNVKWIFEAKDYIRYRLTGVAQAEITDFSGANVINLTTMSYDKEILDLFNLSEFMDKLPPLCQSTDICGKITKEAQELCGLMAGTPVIGGMFDIDACMIAARVIDEKDICMIAGSWGVNLYLRREPVLDKSIMMNTIFALPEFYLIEDCSPASASNLSWFIRTFLNRGESVCEEEGSDFYDLTNQWVESLTPDTYCPVYMPFLYGTHAHPNAMACFVGASGHHDIKHFTRGLYEGVAFAHKHHFDRLMKSRKVNPRVIRMAGGAAKSQVWAQMFADVMGYPVETVDANEMGTLGCAIAVATALGIYPDLLTASSTMSRIQSVYRPNHDNHKIYEKKYELYKSAVRSLDEVWHLYQDSIESILH